MIPKLGMLKQVDAKDFPLRTFADRMLEQLETHDEQNKLKFTDMSVEALLDLMGANVSKRFPKIWINATKPIMTKEDLDIAILQLEHFGNFVYFPWAKLNTIRAQIISEGKPIGI